MATLLGDRITNVHRAAQVALVLPVANVARGYAGILQPDKPVTTTAYMDLLWPTIDRSRQASQVLASRYYTQLSVVESQRSSYRSTPAPRQDDLFDRVRASVEYHVGHRYKKRLDTGTTPERAAEQLRIDLVGTAVRNTLNAGRDQIRHDVLEDRTATGWVRITAMDNKVCWFCAMLATRTDYKEASFDKSDPRFEIGGNPMANAKVHDHCRCMLRPVFDYERPERNQWLEDEWSKVVSEDPDDIKKAWREHWENLIATGQVPWLGATA